MTREEFYQEVKDAVNGKLEEAGYREQARAELTVNQKPGGISRTALVIRDQPMKIMPCLYLEEEYGKFLDGETVEQIADRLIEMDKNLRPRQEQDIRQAIAYENAKANLFMKATDTRKSREYLEGHPHTEVGDLSATYHIRFQMNEYSSSSIAVNHEMLASWGISQEQLHADALENSRTMVPPFFCPVENMIGEMLDENLTAVNLLESPLESQKNQYMYVMTNKWKNFGASAVFDPEALQKAAEAIGGTDFFILPSSVHELMIVPDNGEMDYRELCGMVREVNQNEVDPKDFLSDRVQYYDRGTKRVLGQEEYLEKFQGKQKTEEQQRSFGHGLPQRDRRIISPGF